MTKRNSSFLYGGLLVLALALIILMKTGIISPFQKSHYAVITSSDGALELGINPLSLPEGVSMEDIKITKLSHADLKIAPPADQLIAAYELEPDGLEVKKPLFIRHELPLEGDLIPNVLVLSEKYGVETPEELVVTLDRERGSMTIAGELSHFSHYIIHNAGSWISLTGPTVAAVGESIEAKTEIKINGKPTQEPFQDLETADIIQWYYPAEEFWAVGNLQVVSGPLSPKLVKNVPKKGDYKTDTEIKSSGTLTCNGPGQAILEYRAQIQTTGHKEWLANSGFGVLMSMLSLNESVDFFTTYTVRETVECIGGETDEEKTAILKPGGDDDELCWDYEESSSGGSFGLTVTNIIYRECEPGEKPRD
ncbi:MAG: hypothetical protein OEY44_00380 [Candidatus Peregrinibacteria bacterium]|nr:hypothetical protein [Candidatus Peregrinibacteria bacterium]